MLYCKIQHAIICLYERKVTLMTMGEYIKHLRKKFNMTQEELGQKLNPSVNRAAINKWESGQVQNIKRSYIQQMSTLFNVKPHELMCFDQEINITEKNISVEQITKVFGKEAMKLLEMFNKLNHIGKNKILNDLDDLTHLVKYTKD